MNIDSDFVLAAINTVLDWDMSDEACSDAVTAQACHLARLDTEDVWSYDVDAMVH